MSTAITNKIANDRDIQVWVVPETVIGTLQQPLAEHFVSAFDITYPKQVPDYENSKERAATRDVLDRCQGAMPAGEWSFSTKCRPTGLGMVPVEHNLIHGLEGLQTVNSGVSVEYEPAMEKPSYSIWFLVDHTMIFCSGATVGGATLNLEDCSLVWQWSGGFMRMGIAGTDDLRAIIAPASAIAPVTDKDKFSIGGVVVLTDSAGVVVDDNSGVGYTVTGISDTVEELSVTPAFTIGAAADGLVRPLDVGGIVDGNPLETRHSTVTIDSVVKPVIGFSFVFSDNPEYLTREKTASGYPESYAEVVREITGEVALAFRRDEAGQFKKAIEGESENITLDCGDLPGYMLKIEIPRASIDVPELNEETPIVEMTINYTALAITGEDSNKVTYL